MEAQGSVSASQATLQNSPVSQEGLDPRDGKLRGCIPAGAQPPAPAFQIPLVRKLSRYFQGFY